MSDSVIPGIEFDLARSGDADALIGLFERAAAPCCCQYWRFEGSRNDWLDRCANARELNQSRFRDELAELRGVLPRDHGSSESQGFVARSADRALGWLRVARVSFLHKQYEQRLYRGLPCFDPPRERVWALGCFLVDPAARRRGVARGLLEQAITWAESAGIVALEALPRRDPAAGDAELFLGPFDLLLDQGFRVVYEFGPYPVLRLQLSRRSAPPR